MKLDSKSLVKYFAEFVGTFIFVTIIFLSATVARGVEAFSIGLGLIALIYAFNKLTVAHFNPLITIGTLVAKKTNLKDSIFYMLVQLAAVFLAFGVGLLARNAYIDFEVVQNTQPGAAEEQIQDIRGQIEEVYVLHNEYPEEAETISYILEGFFAYIFVLVALLAIDNEKSKNAAGFVIGITLFVAIAVSAQITGGAFHPFRSLVPALFNFEVITEGRETLDTLNYFGVYVLGPIFAAILAGLTYWSFKLVGQPMKLSAKVGKDTSSKTSKKEAKKDKKSDSKKSDKKSKKKSKSKSKK